MPPPPPPGTTADGGEGSKGRAVSGRSANGRRPPQTNTHRGMPDHRGSQGAELMPVSASRSLRYIQNATLSKALLDIFGRKVGEYFCNRPPLWQRGSPPPPPPQCDF